MDKKIGNGNIPMKYWSNTIEQGAIDQAVNILCRA